MPGEALAEELRKIQRRYHHSMSSLDIFVRDSLKGIGEKQETLAWALNQIQRFSSDDEEADPDLKIIMNLGTVGKMKATLEMAMLENLHIVEPHTRMLLEMSVAYASALFDGLVSDVLIIVFRHMPEALRSGRTLTAEEVLAFPSREAIIEELARRDAVELAYKSIEAQFNYFQRAFNIDVFGIESLDVTLADLAAVHERRNLIIHNNGLASAHYVAEYCTSGSIGDPVIVNAESAKSDREILRKIGIALIYSFHDKFAPSKNS